jgi:hypothetical protein
MSFNLIGHIRILSAEMTIKSNIFMKYTPVLSVLLLAIIVSACGGDYRQRAQGQPSEIVVAMDSSRIEGPIGQALNDTYGEYIRTMPRREPMYDLRFRDFKSQAELESVQKSRNLIFAGTLDEQTNIGMFLRSILSEDVQNRVKSGELREITLRDRWYRDQWIVIYTGTDETEIAQRIRNGSRGQMNALYELELERWTEEVYRRGEQPLLADTLMMQHGFKIRVQHDYVKGIDTTDFVSLRRYLEDNDRWIWFHWIDGVKSIDFVTQEWIHAKRDSLLEIYIRGSRPEAFTRTDHRRSLETRTIQINGKTTYESKGMWVMNDFSMGGPFINYLIFDDVQQRLYFMEFGQFSPRFRQRRFLYQFEAIARTFETDPNFKIGAEPTSSEPESAKTITE